MFLSALVHKKCLNLKLWGRNKTEISKLYSKLIQCPQSRCSRIYIWSKIYFALISWKVLQIWLFHSFKSWFFTLFLLLLVCVWWKESNKILFRFLPCSSFLWVCACGCGWKKVTKLCSEKVSHLNTASMVLLNISENKLAIIITH